MLMKLEVTSLINNNSSLPRFKKIENEYIP